MERLNPFNISGPSEFLSRSLQVFHFQWENNEVYREYCTYLGVRPAMVTETNQIPFLPIEVFKQRKVVCGNPSAPVIFSSSGTTGSQTSKHYVGDISIYEESFLRGFEHFYGPVSDYCILALLPSYLEREGSSLIYMVNDLIAKSAHPKSGFYLNNFKELKEALTHLDSGNAKVLLIGVSFALLDFVDLYPMELGNTLIMETGGMKGRKKEIVREELHTRLKQGFGVKEIHSEYGMTELLSQAYSRGSGFFETPPWMKVLVRDPEDPLSIQQMGKTGGINVIDLANIDSCSFVATQDLGRLYSDGRFDILGRFDASDIRGCNLMAL